MEMLNLEKELQSNSYPGRGIIIGRSADGTKAVTAYFIMGRSRSCSCRIDGKIRCCTNLWCTDNGYRFSELQNTVSGRCRRF